MLAVSLKNAELFQVVDENSVRDSLTGRFNRKHAIEVIDGELRRARRSHMALSLIMFDLDHFKQINDGYGHLCGEAVLADVGQRMNAVLRGSDIKCRYGGEEFLILLPDTTPAGARRVANLIRTKLEETPVHWNNVDVPVTASFGLTGALPGELDVKDDWPRRWRPLSRQTDRSQSHLQRRRGRGAGLIQRAAYLPPTSPSALEPIPPALVGAFRFDFAGSVLMGARVVLLAPSRSENALSAAAVQMSCGGTMMLVVAVVRGE